MGFFVRIEDNQVDVDYDITPLGMLNNAHVWNEIYKQNIIHSDLNYKAVAIYCFLISLEMYLKAYLIFLDKNFSKQKKLKNLGHNFILIFKKIKKRAPRDFANQIESTLNKYNLLINDFSLLRYPKRGDKINIHEEIFSGNHQIYSIFNLIEKEIKKSKNR